MSLRPLVPALFFALPAIPVWADQIDADLQTRHVTVFPMGAAIQWVVDIPASPGSHEVTIPGLPRGMAENLKVSAEGAQIGQILARSADPALEGAVEPETVTQARERLLTAQDALRNHEAQVNAKRAESASWRQRAEMVRDMMRGDARITAADLSGSVDQAGGLIATYLENEAKAASEAELLANRSEPLQRAAMLAESDLARIVDQTGALDTLKINIQTTAPQTQLVLTGFTHSASWVPVYDLALDSATGQLIMDRSVSVQQSSGIDWTDVALTLSTAQMASQTQPTDVPSWMPRAESNDAKSYSRTVDYAATENAFAGDARMEAAPAPEAQAVAVDYGITLAYEFPGPVNVSHGSEALRLPLDQKTFETTVLAEAAPRFDTSAYLVAEGINSSGEPILPGATQLRLDGALVGSGSIDSIVPGDDLRVGFGPVVGMTAELRRPEEKEGSSGFISRSNQQTITETLIVRNLTDREWPLRVVDRIPVSRQDELRVDWSASPDPTETDPDGRLGILYWEEPLPAGETREIKLTTDLRWPEGKGLY